MRIQDSSIQLSASHEASSSRTLEIETTTSFRTLFRQLAEDEGDEQAEALQRVQQLLQSLVDAILAAIDGKGSKAGGEKIAGCELLDGGNQGSETAPARRAEVTWRQCTTETICESEKTTVCGKGKVNTADGRCLDLDFSWAMSRDYSAKRQSEESGTVVLKDPLVLNFAGNACTLTDQRVDFDLDADGRAESIPGIGAGSGYLVFDRNGNGKADDGSELFGAKSGNGFADLARLDDDHNGWIDEGDAAWSKLGLWSADGYQSLTQRGVGALYTTAVDAPFALKNSDNELLGQIRAAGLYLSEAGEVGSMQQVDLAVSAPAAVPKPQEGQQLAA